MTKGTKTSAKTTKTSAKSAKAKAPKKAVKAKVSKVVSNSPIALVKKNFGDKAKLVEAVSSFAKDDSLWLAHKGESKGLEHVSNSKLLKLHATFTEVKSKFGTRANLATEICKIENRKDEGYKARLLGFPVARLYDLYKTASKRAGAAKPVAKKEAKPAKPAAKKPAAKKAAK